MQSYFVNKIRLLYEDVTVVDEKIAIVNLSGDCIIFRLLEDRAERHDEFTGAWNLRDSGHFVVEKAGKKGILSTEMKIAVPIIYNDIEVVFKKIAFCELSKPDKEFAAFTLSGKELIKSDKRKLTAYRAVNGVIICQEGHTSDMLDAQLRVYNEQGEVIYSQEECMDYEVCMKFLITFADGFIGNKYNDCRVINLKSGEVTRYEGKSIYTQKDSYDRLILSGDKGFSKLFYRSKSSHKKFPSFSTGKT